jgi:hypothetical protein
MHLSVEELLHYTDEERQRWEKWFRENGEDLLRMPVSGDRENTVGALIIHMFGPELRYVQRLRGEPLTEYRGRPCHHMDSAGHHRSASTRKVILHALMHEVRHWAQIARLMRERGFAPPGGHDLLMSSALI